MSTTIWLNENNSYKDAELVKHNWEKNYDKIYPKDCI